MAACMLVAPLYSASAVTLPMGTPQAEPGAALGTAARIKRALTFYSRVVPILGAYKAAELAAPWAGSLPQGVLPEPLASASAEGDFTKLHDWGSQRLENTIQELKGFYVKTGASTHARVCHDRLIYVKGFYTRARVP